MIWNKTTRKWNKTTRNWNKTTLSVTDRILILQDKIKPIAMNFEFAVLEQLIRPVKEKTSEEGYHKSLFCWCQNIYEENDRLFDILSIGIRQRSENSDAQLAYICTNIQLLEDIIAMIPMHQEEFERRFITNNIETLVQFLEEEHELKDPNHYAKILIAQYQRENTEGLVIASLN